MDSDQKTVSGCDGGKAGEFGSGYAKHSCVSIQPQAVMKQQSPNLAVKKSNEIQQERQEKCI